MILARRGRPRKTVEDFMNLPEETRAELIDGELFVMGESPRVTHQRVVGTLLSLLGDHVENQRLGLVFMALDVHLPSGDIVEPDIIFIAKDNLGIVQDWVRGVPDLIIEVLSQDRRERDRIVKRGLYAENRVPEYWIVDPETAGFEIITLHGETYEPSGYFEKSDILVSPSLPDFKLTVAEVFAQPR